VLGLHCLVYLAFITATTFGTYYVSTHYPEYFLKRFAPTLLGTSVVMLALWTFFGGCPLTWLENLILRKHHPSLQYQSSCTNHYAERWFGLCLPKKFSGYKKSAIMFVVLQKIMSLADFFRGQHKDS
jgi:hypothetical protein